MTKDIILTIRGLHQTDEEAADPIEITLPGQYFLKNGKHYVVYEELMEGLDGALKSTLKFTGDQVELLRSGKASTRMTFQEDTEHQAVYQTPMGAMPLSIYTQKLQAELLEDQMELAISYSLKSQGIVVSESTLQISVCSRELKTFE